MLKVGVVGISGYSGCAVLEYLLKHKEVRITYVSASNTRGAVEEIWPHLTGLTKLVCEEYSASKAIELCDLIFLAVPHTIAMTIAPELLKAGKRVIDFSGDYRLPNTDQYAKWYGTEHKDSSNLKKAVYGLPELYREAIKKATLVSNPGCYPTSAILGLAPIASTHSNDISSIIIDAKSGVSGAGRKVTKNFIFCEVNENFKAYKALNHQHAPEIDLHLSKLTGRSISVNFVPHLLPINRGILSTIYVQLKNKMSAEGIHKIYKNFYKTEPFVRVLPLGGQPELRGVAHTNFCDLGFAVNDQVVCITSAIDNLAKGAAGQAVQNMNIMYGFKEEESLL